MAMSAATTSIELDQLSNAAESQDITFGEPEAHTADQSLERVDGGPSAWRMLCAAFVFEAILWGALHEFHVIFSHPPANCTS